jgi:amidase
MPVEVPKPRQLRKIADEVGLHRSDGDVDSFIELMRPTIGAYSAVDAIPDNLPLVRYPRAPGYRPTGEENKQGT